MNIIIEIIYYDHEQGTSNTYTINSNKIITCDWSNNVLDSDLSINPGVCEQYAEIKIYDEFLADLIEDKADALLNPLDITSGNIKGYVDDGQNIIKVFSLFISEVELDSDNNIIKLSARDPSYIFKDDTFIVQASPIGDYTVRAFFDYIESKVPYTFQEANSYVLNFTTNLVFKDGFIERDNLYNILMTICNAAMLRVYWTNEDVFIIDEVLV